MCVCICVYRHFVKDGCEILGIKVIDNLGLKGVKTTIKEDYYIKLNHKGVYYIFALSCIL